MITTCFPLAVIWSATSNPEADPVGLREVLHRLMDTAQIPPTEPKITRDCGTECQHDGVIAIAQLIAGDVDPDVDAGAEDGALAAHLIQTAIEVLLLHLELGNAVSEQAAEFVFALVDRDGVPGPGQLLRHGQSGRTRTDHGNRLAG